MLSILGMRASYSDTENIKLVFCAVKDTIMQSALKEFNLAWTAAILPIIYMFNKQTHAYNNLRMNHMILFLGMACFMGTGIQLRLFAFCMKLFVAALNVIIVFWISDGVCLTLLPNNENSYWSRYSCVAYCYGYGTCGKCFCFKQPVVFAR